MRTSVRRVSFVATTALLLGALAAVPAQGQHPTPLDVSRIPSSPPQLSVAVRDLRPSPASAVTDSVEPRVNPLASLPGGGATSTPASGAQTRDPLIGAPSRGTRTPAPSLTFDGTGNPEGCGGCAPPDTTGDVGPNHYVQMVNSTKVAVFDKSGVLLAPAFNLSTLFTSGACSLYDHGDPQVLYDPMADRWLLAQFTPRGENLLCFAISRTADPLGAYYLYSFQAPQFPDYFKVGVWPGGYYVSSNEDTYAAYALDRTKMLAGLPASAVRVGGQTNMLMPADVDGPAPPDPQGGLFYTFKSRSFHGTPADELQLFRLTPDFETPANTTFTTVATIPIAPFIYTVCGYFAMDCIPQRATAWKLDAVSEWPMQRFAYRRLADREALVGNFTVGGGTASPGAAIRWFELSDTGSGWTLRQEGTQDLGDGLNRFMGSIAMDADGTIAIGYSASSATEYPSVRYATRLASDPPGTMQAEQVLQAGGGSQLGADRWGDYSAMSVDPSTDRAFWYTNEYYATSSSRDWSTVIGRFAFAAQAITFPQPPDVAVTAATTTLSATGGGSGNPVTFASTTPTTCTTGGTNGATVTLVGLGTCSVTASQAGDGSYAAAPPVTRSFSIVKASQTITGPPLTLAVTLTEPVTFTAAQLYASSGLPVSLQSLTPDVCSASGTTVVPVATGTCTVVATQAGDAQYSPASVTVSCLSSVPVPTVTGVTPATGLTTGGRRVTLTGTNFVAGTRVWFGSAPVTSVSVTSSTSMTVTAPSHPAGSVTVLVTLPNGRSASAPHAFRYLVKQVPRAPLRLPTALRPAGWTRLLAVPVVTNAGQRASVLVSFTPVLAGIAGKGDLSWYRVVTIRGWVWAWLSGKVAGRVSVTVKAPAVPNYTPYRGTTTYATPRVR